MIVNDILDDAKEIFGICEGTKLNARITQAIELLSNESQWDAGLGYVTLNSDEEGVVALPRDIEVPLGVNLDGFPAFSRDRWFQFHINGPGQFTRIDGLRRMWDDQGDFATIIDLTEASFLTLTAISINDAAASITIFGRDENGNELRTGANRGIILTAGGTTAVKVLCVETVSKSVTNDSLELRNQTNNDLLGLYFADQTSPTVRRVRFPKNTTVTIQYRRSNLLIKSVNDFIPLDSHLALVAAMKSVKNLFNDNEAKQQFWIEAATKIAEKEQETRNPRSPTPPQVMYFSSRGKGRLRFGRHGHHNHCCRNNF